MTNCTHEKYRQPSYMCADNIYKAMERADICWSGKIVQKCECGTDISHAKRVQVKTASEYLGGFNIDRKTKKDYLTCSQ